MIAIWPGLVDASERKGWEDGSAHRKFAPLLTEGLNEEADEAYSASYWLAFIHVRPA